MKILVDTHTHTNCSTHAFGTVWENLTMAKRHGMEMVCMTNHGPNMPDAPHIWHFETMYELPEEIDGVRLLKGAEANVLDTEGNLDIPLGLQKDMDMMIASIHRYCYTKKTPTEHTKTWLKVIENPYVTILGHTGHPDYAFDHEAVVEAAKKHKKCIEINNHSFYVRKGSIENCRKIAECCKKIGTGIVVSSDAHTPFQVGVFDKALELLKEVDFPEDLVVNQSVDYLKKYLRKYQ